MADFDTLESGREGSRPLEVYKFTLGVDTFLYTSAEDVITLDLDVFQPEAISRGSIGQGGDNRNRNLIITVPSGNEFARKYINIVPGTKASLRLLRLQRDETPAFDTRTLGFQGQVQSVRFPQDGHAAEITVRSIETALNRNMPRFTYMGTCNHVLYDNGCKVDPTLFTVVGNVSAVSGNTITVTGASSKANGFFTGGFCKPSAESDFRMVLKHVGDVLTLLLPFAQSVLNTNVEVFAGCDHLLKGDCALKFDQVLEYGGSFFVPLPNIFQTGVPSA